MSVRAWSTIQCDRKDHIVYKEQKQQPPSLTVRQARSPAFRRKRLSVIAWRAPMMEEPLPPEGGTPNLNCLRIRVLLRLRSLVPFVIFVVDKLFRRQS